MREISQPNCSFKFCLPWTKKTTGMHEPEQSASNELFQQALGKPGQNIFGLNLQCPPGTRMKQWYPNFTLLRKHYNAFTGSKLLSDFMLIFSETQHCVTTCDVSSDWLNKQNNSQPLYEFNVFRKAKTPCIRYIKNLKKVAHLLLLPVCLRLSLSVHDPFFPFLFLAPFFAARR